MGNTKNFKSTKAQRIRYFHFLLNLDAFRVALLNLKANLCSVYHKEKQMWRLFQLYFLLVRIQRRQLDSQNPKMHHFIQSRRLLLTVIFSRIIN